MTNHNADFLVVGGGPGGKSVASNMARRGHSVQILEAREEGSLHPPLVCDDFDVRTLRELGAGNLLRGTTNGKQDGFEIYSSDGTCLEFDPLPERTTPVSRSIFDQNQTADAHDAGVKIEWGARVDEILGDGHTVKVGGVEFTANKKIINAAGAKWGPNGKNFKKGDVINGRRMFLGPGIQTLKKGAARKVHIMAQIPGLEASPEVCWCNRTPEGYWDIFIGSLEQEPTPEMIQKTLDYFRDFHGVSFGDEIYSYDAPIPVGCPVTDVDKDGVFRIGDAASAADPMMGSGVTPTLQSADLAAEYLDKHDYGEGPELTNVEVASYLVEMMDNYGAGHFATKRLEELLAKHPEMVNVLVRTRAMTKEDGAAAVGGMGIDLGPGALLGKSVRLLLGGNFISFGRMATTIPGAAIGKRALSHLSIPQDDEAARETLDRIDRIMGRE